MLLLVWALAAGVWAEPAPRLAPGLQVHLPTALSVVVLPETEWRTGPVLAGEIDNQLAYFMAAVPIASSGRQVQRWRRLENDLRRHSDSGFSVPVRGSLLTEQGVLVWYRAYHYRRDGQAQQQVYFLLSAEPQAYWITLTMVEGVSLDVALPLARTLIRRFEVD